MPGTIFDLKLTDIPKVLLAAANMSAMILYIITNAVLFSFLMTSAQIPQSITAWATSLASDRCAGVVAVAAAHVRNVALTICGDEQTSMNIARP